MKIYFEVKKEFYINKVSFGNIVSLLDCLSDDLEELKYDFYLPQDDSELESEAADLGMDPFEYALDVYAKISRQLELLRNVLNVVPEFISDDEFLAIEEAFVCTRQYLREYLRGGKHEE